MSSLSGKRFRVGAIGTYGNGNLGDEAVFVAFLQWLRHHAPEIEPVSLCVNPRYIEQSYGLPAVAVSAHDAGRREDGSRGEAEPPSAPVPRAAARDASAAGSGKGLRAHLRRSFPAGVRVFRWLRQAVTEALAIARFFPTQLRVASTIDAMIVLGGGQVHDFWYGPLGHPATLCLWALACRLTGKPFLIASVGAVELKHGLSRWFIRKAFFWAAHATARDQDSARILRSLGARLASRILPDLAWGVECAPVQALGRAGAAARQHQEAARFCSLSGPPRIIGVSPMVYRHPRLWPAGDAVAYSGYIETLASFCSRLIREGYDVVLFPTQIRSDGIAIQDVAAGIPRELKSRVYVEPVDGIERLLHCLAGVDAVVATRFHGLLLSLLAGRPALSISYQQKNDALLRELGKAQFALDIHRLSSEELWASFEQLCQGYDEYAARIGPHVEHNRRMLDAQYRQVFRHLGWQSRLRHPGPIASAS